MNIRMDSDPHGRTQFRPCCHYQSASPNTTLDQYLASQQLADLQKHVLTQNELPAACGYCAHEESQGLRSLREITLTELPVSLDHTRVTNIEVFPGNNCNLACVMCDPKFSTHLAQQHQQLGWIDVVPVLDNTDATLDALTRLPDLKTVGFIGGEFFLTKRNLEILDLVISRGLAARIITNATVITPQHLDRLRLIQDLDVMISVDGTHQVYEFIRYPAKWATLEQNVSELSQALCHAKIHVYSVVQPLNLTNIVPLLHWANRRLLPVTLANLQQPTWLSWAVLTPAEKQKMSQKVRAQLEAGGITRDQKAQVSQFLQHMLSTDWNADLREQFDRRLSQLRSAKGVSGYDFATAAILHRPL